MASWPGWDCTGVRKGDQSGHVVTDQMWRKVTVERRKLYSSFTFNIEINRCLRWTNLLHQKKLRTVTPGSSPCGTLNNTGFMFRSKLTSFFSHSPEHWHSTHPAVVGEWLGAHRNRYIDEGKQGTAPKAPLFVPTVEGACRVRPAGNSPFQFTSEIPDPPPIGLDPFGYTLMYTSISTVTSELPWSPGK